MQHFSAEGSLRLFKSSPSWKDMRQIAQTTLSQTEGFLG